MSFGVITQINNEGKITLPASVIKQLNTSDVMIMSYDNEDFLRIMPVRKTFTMREAITYTGEIKGIARINTDRFLQMSLEEATEQLKGIPDVCLRQLFRAIHFRNAPKWLNLTSTQRAILNNKFHQVGFISGRLQ